MLYEVIQEEAMYEEAALLRYGFVKQSAAYVYRQQLSTAELYCQIKLYRNEIHVDVYEAADDERFLPFYVKHNQSSYVNMLKEEIADLLARMKEQCFTKAELKQALIAEMLQLFHTPPEYPWDNEAHCVLRTRKQQKWYALFMRIPYQVLKKDQQGFVEIVNLKADPKVIARLLDYEHYFPAYHMNKTHWITVLLDHHTNREQVIELLKESYRLVEK